VVRIENPYRKNEVIQRQDEPRGNKMSEEKQALSESIQATGSISIDEAIKYSEKLREFIEENDVPFSVLRDELYDVAEYLRSNRDKSYSPFDDPIEYHESFAG